MSTAIWSSASIILFLVCSETLENILVDTSSNFFCNRGLKNLFPKQSPIYFTCNNFRLTDMREGFSFSYVLFSTLDRSAEEINLLTFFLLRLTFLPSFGPYCLPPVWSLLITPKDPVVSTA